MTAPSLALLEQITTDWSAGTAGLPLNMVLLKVPTDLTTKAATVSGDTLTFASPHGFVEGEIIKLDATTYPANLPVANTYTHPYYFAIAVTATTCKLSATSHVAGAGNAAAIPALGGGAVGLTARSIDLGAEVAAQGIYSTAVQAPGTPAAIFNPTIAKNEVLLPTPRPALQFSAAAAPNRPATWPGSGKLSAGRVGTVTVANNTASPIVYRHALLIRQGHATLPNGAPIFQVPGSADTTIAVSAQQAFNFTIGFFEA